MKREDLPGLAGSLLIVAMLASPCVSAQLSSDEAASLIIDMYADSVPVPVIVETLDDQNLSAEEALLLLANYINTSSVDTVLAALVDVGMPLETATELLLLNYSGADKELKLEELRNSGTSREELLRIAATLTLFSVPAERITALTALGFPLTEAARHLIFLTIAPGPEEILNTLVALGMPMTEVINLLIATDSTAAFELPLAELLNQPFGPGAFSNDPQAGTPGGGVSTSQ